MIANSIIFAFALNSHAAGVPAVGRGRSARRQAANIRRRLGRLIEEGHSSSDCPTALDPRFGAESHIRDKWTPEELAGRMIARIAYRALDMAGLDATTLVDEKACTKWLELDAMIENALKETLQVRLVEQAQADPTGRMLAAFERRAVANLAIYMKDWRGSWYRFIRQEEVGRVVGEAYAEVFF